MVVVEVEVGVGVSNIRPYMHGMKMSKLCLHTK